MPSFDPTMLNIYLYGVLALAPLALGLALGVATAEIKRNRRLSRPAPQRTHAASGVPHGRSTHQPTRSQTRSTGHEVTMHDHGSTSAHRFT